MVKIGNFYYFLYIFVAMLSLVTFYFLLRNKSKKFQYNFILIMSFLNLALHFAKLLFQPYFSELPESIRKITFENICAISTLLSPFIILYKKNKWLNNYFFFISLVGGFLALFYPTEALNKSAFTFDTIRFYYCHITLFLVPSLIGFLKLYTPEYKKIYQIPMMFIAIESLILINEFILYEIGFVSNSLTDFFSNEVRNSSFVFGPLPEFYNFCKFILIFVPKIFTKNVFGVENLDTLYWPVIWLIIPTFIYLPIVYEIVILPFSYKNILVDIRKFKSSKSN